MSKHTRWQCSKSHGISSGSYKVPGYHPFLSLGTQEQGTGQEKTTMPKSHQTTSQALLAGKLQGIFHPFGMII